MPAAEQFRKIKICSGVFQKQGVGCEANTNALLRRHHRIVHNQPTKDVQDNTGIQVLHMLLKNRTGILCILLFQYLQVCYGKDALFSNK